METKICGKCKVEKLVSEFFRDRTRKDGLKPRCKECADLVKEKLPIPRDGFKYCIKCKIEVPLLNFYKNRKRKDGHDGTCINCFRGGKFSNSKRRIIKPKCD